jgi:hypothetical protein
LLHCKNKTKKVVDLELVDLEEKKLMSDTLKGKIN